MRSKLFMYAVAACLLALVWATIALAGDATVLVISGKGVDGEIRLTEEDIRALPQANFTTFDPWDSRKRTYTGPRVLDVLAAIGASEDVELVEVIARNDYRAKITLEELVRYGHILSWSMDGYDYSQLVEDDKGPLALAVNMEDVPSEDQLRIKDQLVWWVEKMVLY